MHTRFPLALVALLAAPLHARPPATLKADCTPHSVAGARLAACLKADTLTVRLGAAPSDPALTRIINPEGTFDDVVTIDHVDAARIALRYADSECDVALIVERATGRVLADSGCRNSQYCAFALPSAKTPCSATLTCSDGGDGTQSRAVDVCAAAAPAANGPAATNAPAAGKTVPSRAPPDAGTPKATVVPPG